MIEPKRNDRIPMPLRFVVNGKVFILRTIPHLRDMVIMLPKPFTANSVTFESTEQFIDKLYDSEFHNFKNEIEIEL